MADGKVAPTAPTLARCQDCHLLPSGVAVVWCKQAGIFGPSCHSARTPPARKALSAARASGRRDATGIQGGHRHARHPAPSRTKHLFWALDRESTLEERASGSVPLPINRKPHGNYPLTAVDNQFPPLRARRIGSVPAAALPRLARIRPSPSAVGHRAPGARTSVRGRSSGSRHPGSSPGPRGRRPGHASGHGRRIRRRE